MRRAQPATSKSTMSYKLSPILSHVPRAISNVLSSLRSALCATRHALRTIPLAPCAIRYALYALLVFTPLVRGSVQGWAVTIIQMVTLIALSVFLFEKNLTWNWKWIRTPLDKPILCLLFLCFLSSVFSLHRYTSTWSFILLLNYLAIFYLTIYAIRTRANFKQIVYLIIGVETFLSL